MRQGLEKMFVGILAFCVLNLQMQSLYSFSFSLLPQESMAQTMANTNKSTLTKDQLAMKTAAITQISNIQKMATQVQAAGVKQVAVYAAKYEVATLTQTKAYSELKQAELTYKKSLTSNDQAAINLAKEKNDLAAIAHLVSLKHIQAIEEEGRAIAKVQTKNVEIVANKIAVGKIPAKVAQAKQTTTQQQDDYINKIQAQAKVQSRQMVTQVLEASNNETVTSNDVQTEVDSNLQSKITPEGEVTAKAEVAQESAELSEEATTEITSISASSNEAAAGEDEISKATFMDVLIMIIIGLLASTILMKTPKPTASIILVSAGGIIYIAGELAAIGAHKSYTKEQEDRYLTDGKITSDTQKNAIEEQKKAYENIKKTANTKSNLQKAAGGMFLAAMAIDLALAIVISVLLPACTVNAGVYPWNPLIPSCPGLALPNSQLIQTLQPATVICTLQTSYMSAYSKTLQSCPGICSAASVIVDLATPICNPFWAKNNKKFKKHAFLQLGQASNLINTVKKKDNLINLTIKKSMDLLFPPAKANIGSLLGGMAAGIAIALILKFTMSQYIDLYLSSAILRSVIYGVLGGLALGAAASTANIATKAQENIDRLDDLLKGYENFAGTKNLDTTETPGEQNEDGNSSGNEDGGNQVGNDDSNNIDLDKYDTVAIVPDANLFGTNNIREFAPTFPCAIPTDSGCGNSTKLFNQNLKAGKIKLDQVTSDYATAGLAVSDKISGSKEISPSTLKDIESLARNANTMSKKVKNLKKLYNLKNKKDPIDFKQRENRFLDHARALVAKELAKKGLTAKDVMGQMALGLSEDFSSEKQASAKKVMDKINNLKPNTFGDANFSMPKFDFGSKGLGSSSKLKRYNKNKAALARKKGKRVRGDIVNNKGVSLFKIISVRYLKSAILKLDITTD